MYDEFNELSDSTEEESDESVEDWSDEDEDLREAPAAKKDELVRGRRL